jgi:predicted RNase H-like HicB family nuclease
MDISDSKSYAIQADNSPAIMREALQQKMVELLALDYPVQIHVLDDHAGERYFFAFLVDFGWCACSATGDTVEEALANLHMVKVDILQHFLETDHPIPMPSKCPAEV